MGLEKTWHRYRLERGAHQTIGSRTGHRDHRRSNPKITHPHCTPINCSCVVRCCMFITGLRRYTTLSVMRIRHWLWYARQSPTTIPQVEDARSLTLLLD
jgi:hypothetical protein